MRNIIFRSSLRRNSLKLLFTIGFLLFGGILQAKTILPFTITLTPVSETCTGNGQIIIDIDNTQSGAEFEVAIYQLPNTVTPFRVNNGITATGTTLNYVETALPSGDFRVVVTQTSGAAGTTPETEDVTIISDIESLVFTQTITQLCTGGIVTVNVTEGHPSTYEVRDLSGGVVVSPQTSNALTVTTAGSYNVIVTDVCGDAQSLGVTIEDDPAEYIFLRSSESPRGFTSLEDCSTIEHIEEIRYNNTWVFNPVRFPINIEVVVENPTGGADTVINEVWTSGADNGMSFNVPYYPGETYNYTITLTDNCGKVSTRTDIINASLNYRLRELVGDCSSKYLRLDKFDYIYAPVTFTFTNYPAGFDPADYNSDFITGTYSHTYNDLSIVNSGILFGDVSNGIPAGTYEIETTSCGETITKTINIVDNVTYSLYTRRFYGGCGDNEGSVVIYIRSNGPITQTDDLTNLTITSVSAEAEAEFLALYGPLPFDVSYNIASDGVFYMNSLPAGVYTVEGVGTCGVTIQHNFTVYGKNIDATVEPTFNCGSFNVTATLSSYLGFEHIFLQKYYPSSNSWGHPSSGTLYVDGTALSSSNSIQMTSGTTSFSGYNTISATLNNIINSGEFRVLVQYRIHENGESTTLSCRDVLDTFTIPNTGILLNNYYVAHCGSGFADLMIDATGVPDLNYQIVEFDGTTLATPINNGTNPVFYNLDQGIYKVEITDGCGNVATFEVNTGIAKPMIIYPKDLCDGEIATLSINSLSFLNYEWRKDSLTSPTILSTTNILTFNPFDEATDAGIYYVSIIDPNNPASCLNTTQSYEITSPQAAVEAGTGQTIDVLQQDTSVFNLFDFVTPPYDNYGEWTDLSNTGALSNEVLDATQLTVGTYQFEYIVEGACTGEDSTIVTLNILATDLTATQDDYIDICAVEAINIGNVMDNDTEGGSLIIQSNYTVNIEVADPQGVITVNSDGTIDIASGVQPNQTYTLQYRVYETANVNNFSVGTLTVSTIALPTAAISGNDILTCTTTSITLDATTTGDVSYLWSTGATTASIAVTTPGDYTVTVTDISSGCTADATVTVVQDIEVPTAAISGNDILTCTTTSITLDATTTGDVSYLWSTGATTASIAVTTPGDYTVTVTDISSGCTADATVTVVQDIEVPTAAISGNDILTCTTTSITLDATTTGDVSYLWSTGATTASIAVTTPGDYTVTVTDISSGCTADATVTVVQDIEVPTAAISGNDILTCTTTSITLDATTTGDVSYLWSTGATTASIAVTTPGDYTVTVTDISSGCTADATVTVVQDIEVPTAAISGNDILTCTTTSITLDATTTGDVSYLWSTGATTASIAVTTPGDYTVTVTDISSGCTADATVTVVQDIEVPTAAISGNDILTCTTTSITLDATTTGDVSYLWSTGATTASIAVTTPGDYTVTVTDISSGCTADATVTVVQDIEVPTAAISGNDILTCTTTSITLDATTTGDVSYLWSTGATTASIAVTTPGDYTVTVTDISSGCTADATVTVVQDIEVPTAAISGNDILTCTTTSITLDATTTGDVSYLWSTGATTASIAVTTPGDYTVTVTDISSGCTADATVTVVQDSSVPTAAISGNDILTCTTTSITLDATTTGDVSYLWSTGATTASIAVTTPGDYTVTVTDISSGCTADATVTVVQDIEVPTAAISGNDILTCTTTSITLDATTAGDVSYLWSTGATTASIAVTTPGDYTVTVTDISSGCTADATVTVVQDSSVPTAAISGNDILTCTTTSITLDATTTGDVSYLWSTGATTASIAVTTPGDYTVTVTDISSGCTADATVTVVQDSSVPTAAISGNDILTCTTTSITLDATTTGDVSYLWSTGATTASIAVTTPGDYTVTVTDISSGCTADATVTVVQDIEVPTAAISGNDILTCTTTSITLDATTTGDVSYLWSTGATTASIAVTTPGDYTVTVTDISSGCTADATVTVVQDSSVPTAAISGNDILTCTTTSITLDATTTGDVSYLWSTGATTASIAVTTPGDYTVTVTDISSGCTADATVTVVQDIEVPTAAISGNDILTCTTTTVTLTATPSSSDVSYQWSDVNGEISGAINATLDVTAPGTYSVVVTDISSGCSSSSVAVIVIGDYTTPALTVGEVVCNGSGVYDVLYYSNGDSVISSSGDYSVSGIISGVSVGSSVVITSTNTTTGCTTSIEVNGPSVCPTPSSCVLPDLTVGQAICNGSGYSFSYTETTGAVITVSGSSSDSNGTVTVSDMNSVTITASNDTCIITMVIEAPSNCDQPCELPISIGGTTCGIDSSGYAIYDVSFTTISGATVSSSAGTVDMTNGIVTGIPNNQDVTLTVSVAGCNDVVVMVPGSDCGDSSIELVKEGEWIDLDSDGIVEVGDEIHFTFTVTNTGNVEVTNIILNDTFSPNVTVSGGPILSLAPGAVDTTTFTATYIITQEDIDKGYHLNVALACGSDPNGSTVCDTSIAIQTCQGCTPNPTCPECTQVYLTQLPEFTTTKQDTNIDLGSDMVLSEGDVITYEIAVTNTGNVTISNVVVTDDNADTGSIMYVSGDAVNTNNDLGTLDPGETWIYTAEHTITVLDIANGEVVNQATVGGDFINPATNVVTPITDTTDDPDDPTTDDDSSTPASGPGSDVTVTTLNNTNAVDDINVTNTDQTATGNVLTNDFDQQNDTQTVTPVTGGSTPAGGTFSIDASGNYTYTPPTGWTGTDTFDYTVCDDSTPQACATATVTIEVEDYSSPEQPNNEVVANNDTAAVEVGGTVVINVLSNDYDEDGDSFSITPGSITQPACGTVTLNADGTITYEPTSVDCVGEQSFTYEICDNGTPQVCDSAVVTITVFPEDIYDNDTYANDDVFYTDEDTSIVGASVSVNDVDPEGDTVTYTALDTSDVDSNGTFTFNSDGTFDFTPNTGVYGTFTFTYEVCDDGTPQACDSATVYIVVNPLNDTNAVNDINTTFTDTAVSGNVLTNDFDQQNDTQTVTPVTGGSTPAGGTFSIDASGNYTYTPPTGWTGTDSFTYEVCDDGTPQACDSATIVIEVLPASTADNNGVTANDDAIVIEQGSSVTINVLANDFDQDGDNFSITPGSVTQPSCGTVTDNGDGTISFVPDALCDGLDEISFTYEVCDDGTPQACDSATVTISIIPDNGVNDTSAIDDAFNGDINTVIVGNVLDNDIDPEGDTQSITAGSGTTSTGGVWTIDSQGNITYTPAEGYSGPDSFEYTVCDDGTPQACDSATVYITVNPEENTTYGIEDINVTYEDTAVTGNVLTNDYDDDSFNVQGITTFTIPSNGTLIFDSTTGAYEYTPNTGFTGVDTFTYTVCDNATPAACDEVTVYITVLPLPDATVNTTVAIDDTAQTEIGQGVVINVIANDFDPEGDTLDVSGITVISQPSCGTLVNNLDGTFTFTPDDSCTVGQYTFEYEICDNGTPQVCDSAVVTITVFPEDIYDNDTYANDDVFYYDGTTSNLGSVLDNDTDPEGDTVTVSLPSTTTAGGGTVSVDPNTGAVIYTPALGFTGTDSFEYTVCDNGTPQACDSATVYIVVESQPSLEITKDSQWDDSNGNGMVDAGETITYTYIITNTGNITLTGVGVVEEAVNFTGTGTLPDPEFQYNENPSDTIEGTLLPQQSAVYQATYTITQSDIDAGQLSNLASASGTDSNGTTVSDDSSDPTPCTSCTVDPNCPDCTLTELLQEPRMTLEKEGEWIDTDGDGVVEVGEPILFTFTVTNTGNVMLSNVIVTDNWFTPQMVITALSPSTTLGPNESGVAEGYYYLTQADIDAGGVYNLADATATDPSGDTLSVVSVDPTPIDTTSPYYDPNCSDCTVVVLDLEPSISIIKTAEFNDENGDGQAQEGESITYTFMVTNTGNVSLTDINVLDTLISSATISVTPSTLAPGEVGTATATYYITQSDIFAGSVTNQALVTGSYDSPSGILDVTDLSDDDSNLGDDPTVLAIEGCVITVYNALSVNGDDTNDRLYIRGLECYSENSVEVYNRWGVLVYEAKGYNNEDVSFRGYSEGRVTINEPAGLPTGTYWYVLKYSDSEGNTKEKIGYLYITRD